MPQQSAHGQRECVFVGRLHSQYELAQSTRITPGRKRAAKRKSSAIAMNADLHICVARRIGRRSWQRRGAPRAGVVGGQREFAETAWAKRKAWDDWLSVTVMRVATATVADAGKDNLERCAEKVVDHPHRSTRDCRKPSGLRRSALLYEFKHVDEFPTAKRQRLTNASNESLYRSYGGDARFTAPLRIASSHDVQ
jgi:hypothetical protein